MVFGFFEKHFEATDIPDQTGKVVIVTGGNTGIGYETCLHLAEHNATIYMAARTESRAMAAMQKIKEKNPNAKVHWLKMDLMDLSSVKDAAEEFAKKETRLDVLVNNAGIMGCPYELSKDGIDVQFQTNHLGHYLFTRLLEPVLTSTSRLPDTSVRVVNVSSMAHKMANSSMKFDTFENVNQQYASTWLRYGQSKLSNILFTKALAKRWGNEKIFVNTLHPGVINSELGRGPAASYGRVVSWFYDVLGSITLINTYQGSLTQLYCAASKEIEEKNYRGQYFIPYAKHSQPTAQAQDEKLADNLWELSEKILVEKGFLKV
ncbi:short chain dehydrogenase [Powellomyces hirtus]|nr:short chain dehydrogenase [Powellomyces hirtus]